MTRATEIHCAKVYLREARARRRTNFFFTLLSWAANARRRAAAIPREPAQFHLFGADHG